MQKTLQTFGMSLTLMALVVLALGFSSANAMTAAEIDVEVQEALANLYKHSETARDFGAVAKGMLVFPDVYKAGLMIGGNLAKGRF